MSQPDEYRRLAQACLATARTAASEEARSALIQMAQVWLRLADEQDVPPPPIAADEPQPAVQQQQQPQPKKDEESAPLSWRPRHINILACPLQKQAGVTPEINSHSPQHSHLGITGKLSPDIPNLHRGRLWRRRAPPSYSANLPANSKWDKSFGIRTPTGLPVPRRL